MRELVGYRPHCSEAGLKRNPFWWAEAIWSREPVVFIRPEISKFRAGHAALVGKRKSRDEEGRGGLDHAVLRFAEPKQKGFSRWRGDEAVRRAVTLAGDLDGVAVDDAGLAGGRGDDRGQNRGRRRRAPRR